MSKKLTDAQKKVIEERFDLINIKLTEDWSIFLLVSYIDNTSEMIGKSFSETVEILLEEYYKQIKGRIEAELKNVGVETDERKKSIDVVMRMINPWLNRENSLTASRKMLYPETES